MRVDYEVQERQQNDTSNRRFDRDQPAIILANLSKYLGIGLTQGIVIELDLKQRSVIFRAEVHCRPVAQPGDNESNILIKLSSTSRVVTSSL